MVNKKLIAKRKLRNFRIFIWTLVVLSTVMVVPMVIAGLGGFRSFVV